MIGNTNERKANVEFVKTIVLESSSHLERLDIIYDRTLRNIARGEKPFVDYGTLYQFVRTHGPRAT